MYHTDSNQKLQPDWNKHFNIVQGIANNKDELEMFRHGNCG